MERLGHLLAAGALATAVFFAGTPVRADNVALVVVNGEYRDLGSLPVDGVAETLEQALAAAGFTVTVVENATTGGMLSALRRMSATPDPEGSAVFYFVGYARQLRGRNFMIARNAKPARPFDFVTQGIDLDSVLSSLAKAGGRAQFVVIDGAYPQQTIDALEGLEPGLADQTGPAGAAVVLGAEPGVTLAGPGGGPETARAFAEVMGVPTARLDALALGFATRAEQLSGRRMHAVLGQGTEVPLIAPVVEPEPEPVPEPDPVVAEPEPQPDPEPAVVESGPKRVAAPVTDPTPAPEPEPEPVAQQLSAVEYEAQLPESELRRIQRALFALGLYNGGIDGDFGPLTRRAISGFQRLRGFEATGVLDASQTSLLFELADQ